jgi:putative hemolysin
MTSLTFPPISAGNLSVRLAQDESEIIASQKLRYRIFCGEMGGKASPEIQAQKRDFDAFDQVCDHLLVIDSEKNGEEAIVGTYRLLRKSPMKAIGRFYSESEFDISALKNYTGELLELGRSCVNAEYRNRSVMSLLWRGIGAYVSMHQIKLMFGCASFTGADPDLHARALSYLYYNHLAPESVRLKALPDQYVKMNRVPKEQVDARAALREIPPLIKGYLRLNGVIGDGAVVDYAYNTTDVAIIVETDKVTDKYFDRYGQSGDE